MRSETTGLNNRTHINIGTFKLRKMMMILLVFLIRITNDNNSNNLLRPKANSISPENRNLHRPKENLELNTLCTPCPLKFKNDPLNMHIKRSSVRVLIGNPRKDKRKSNDLYFIIF